MYNTHYSFSFSLDLHFYLFFSTKIRELINNLGCASLLIKLAFASFLLLLFCDTTKNYSRQNQREKERQREAQLFQIIRVLKALNRHLALHYLLLWKQNRIELVRSTSKTTKTVAKQKQNNSNMASLVIKQVWR